MKKLNISNLSKIVGNQKLLQDINVGLLANQIYGVIGSNGAGKTTLFRCILGLSSSIGTIYLDDEKVTDFNYNSFLRKIGVVFPFPDSYGDYTVKEIFDAHIRYYDCPKVDIEKYLENFGLRNLLAQKVSTFSLGMKQRLNISLAFLHNPEILILDEPFNGLDREGIVLLKQLLIDFKQKEKIVIISSHSFAELENIADQIILIQHGEMRATLSVESMRQQGFESLEEFYQSREEEDKKW